jgi:hypothetical protein
MTIETRNRQNYTEDFKRDAVALVIEQGYKPLLFVAGWSGGRPDLCQYTSRFRVSA